ncbi:hypothetical protein COCON_G00063800 [Conger conger]|uniref:Adhesion G-protein coupled receptor G2 n=1 Tax=Conger conger TaxID=82655 RepID=A0A9Q1DSG2_CONCO|nr:hypothetical protein COCON_G00063800 [Conger conger]
MRAAVDWVEKDIAQTDVRLKRLDSSNGLSRRLFLNRAPDDCDAGWVWRGSRKQTSIGCTHARLLPRRGVTRRMPCGALQNARNRKLDSHFLFAFLVAVLYQVHPGEGSFLGSSKAVFAHGCDDHWTLADPQRMPQLTQMTLCVDVRPLDTEGEWTAFTYSKPPVPHYSLALQGDPDGLYVWLLGVQHHFPTRLAPLRWHHMCLQHDAGRRTMTLEVDGEVFKRTVITQAIPPAGELVLGCHSWDTASPKWGAGGAELYLFRIWDDVRKPLACEDGTVVGWNSRDWHMTGISRFTDDTLLCGHKRARRAGLAPIAGRVLPSLIPEPHVVQCSFSEFCAIGTAYYWMSVNLETTGKKTEAELSTWLSQVFNISTCVPSSHTTDSPVHKTANNSTDRDQHSCKNEAETAVSLLQGIEVICNTKEDIRVTNCTVVLQLYQPTDTCLLRQVLQESSLDTSIQAHVLGDVERVGQGLCQNGDTLSPDDGFVRCTSSTSLSDVCSSGGPVNVTCTYKEPAYIPMEMHLSVSQLCNRKEQQYCDCSNFCRDTAAYYVLEVDILSASVSIADVRKMVSQLSSGQTCISPVTICPFFRLISEFYQGAHLQCHGTESRLYSCMVVLKLSQPVDMCAASTVMLYLLEDSDDINFNGAVTRAAICGWPSGPVADLLNSTFTWVSVDLHASEICDSLNPVIFSCKEDEILGVLLKESCRIPTSPPSTSTSSPVTMPLFPPTVTPSSSHNNSTTDGATMEFTTGIPAQSEEAQADQLLEQTRDIAGLNSSQVQQVVSRLEDLLSGPNITLALAHRLLNIVSNLLNVSAITLAASSSRIITAVETLGLKLVVEGRTEKISSDSLALAVRKVDGASFEETSFSIADPNNLQITVRGEQKVRRRTGSLRAPTLGTIILPASLTDDLMTQEQLLASRVQFIFYQRTTVFQDMALRNRSINSGVLATSVANLSISGLRDNVVFTMQNNQPITGNFVASCVFWDHNLNEGSGGWSSDGCTVQNTTEEETTCSCNHLTSFAVLLDISREGITDRLQATIQTFITFIGCGISAIFLSITLLTYLGFEKLRRDIPSKILIQLCTALLFLNLTFLLDSWLALYPDAVGLCISTAFFLHYFLLVSFTWMGLEAFHMYLAIVKVFNSYMSRYMLKFSLFGWGVPLMVVIIVIAISKDNYGLISYGKYTDGSTDEFCWIRNDVAFYVALVAYFCLVFVINLAMFVVVMVQLRRIKRQNPNNSQHRNGLQELRSVAGLTFLLGLTWGFAFFAWGPVNLAFMYLFAILNSLQGFFIFIFHCALKENVRRKWRAYLCCGRLQLPETAASTEWSRTTIQANYKKDLLGTSIQTSDSYLSSSTSFRTNDSTELPTPTSDVSEDSIFTSLQESNVEVVVNSRHRAQRPQ